MKILIVPEIAARESSFVRPGEIQVVGYKEHLEDISRLLDAQDKILAYDESKERDLFESTYPLDNGVTWRSDVGNEGRYCVWIDYDVGFWACVNAAFGFHQKWEVWSKCAKSRARSAE